MWLCLFRPKNAEMRRTSRRAESLFTRSQVILGNARLAEVALRPEARGDAPVSYGPRSREVQLRDTGPVPKYNLGTSAKRRGRFTVLTGRQRFRLVIPLRRVCICLCGSQRPLHLRVGEDVSARAETAELPRNLGSISRPAFVSRIPTVRGNAPPTKTPTGWCGSPCPNTSTFEPQPKPNWTWSSIVSIIGRARDWTTERHTKSSKKPSLHFACESTISIPDCSVISCSLCLTLWIGSCRSGAPPIRSLPTSSPAVGSGLGSGPSNKVGARRWRCFRSGRHRLERRPRGCCPTA